MLVLLGPGLPLAGLVLVSEPAVPVLQLPGLRTVLVLGPPFTQFAPVRAAVDRVQGLIVICAAASLGVGAEHGIFEAG